MITIRHAAGFALGLCATAVLADEGTIRISTQVSGTVNWELTTITAHGFDKANGFTLAVQDVAAGPAAQLALMGGETDVIVSDFLWVARQRAEGSDLVFIPYSKAVGALMVPGDSPAQKLSDLKGLQIGVAGGPVDKSWLILRAYADKTEGFDLAGETEQVFGAPPLIFETALNGELGGAVNFWHFNAKAEAAGMRPLVTVAQAATELGLSPETPLLGYVTTGEFLRAHEGLVTGLAAASRQAKDLLATDDGAWDELRPIMNAKSDAQFAALKAGFRAGIPAPGPVDEQAAGAMLALMANLGGEELMGKVTTLPEGVFVQPGSEVAPVLRLEIEGAAQGGRPVLGPLTLTVAAGETVAVTGPSGVGKTTLLRIVAGLHSGWTGRIDRPDRIAMVFQEPTLLPWRDLVANLTIPAGCSSEAALRWLDEVGLDGMADRLPKSLSLGQQRRLALARAWAAEPELLLMDEPFVSLDPALSSEMMGLFERLRAARPVATLLVTHAPDEAERLADRIVRLEGSPARIAA